MPGLIRVEPICVGTGSPNSTSTTRFLGDGRGRLVIAHGVKNRMADPWQCDLRRREGISNADPVIDAVTRIKKIDLVRYYDEIAQWALPYLQDRPVSLVRASSGI